MWTVNKKDQHIIDSQALDIDITRRLLENKKNIIATNSKRSFLSDVKFLLFWLSAQSSQIEAYDHLHIFRSFVVENLNGLTEEIYRKVLSYNIHAKRITSREILKRRLTGILWIGEMVRRELEISPIGSEYTKFHDWEYLSSLSPTLQDIRLGISRIQGKNELLLDILLTPNLRNIIKSEQIRTILHFAPKQPEIKRAKPLTRDEILKIRFSLGNSLRDIRDKAIILFAFTSGGRRSSEVTGAVMEWLDKKSDGSFLYNLKKSKTNKEERDDLKPIVGVAAKVLEEWLSASGIKEGPIFRPIDRYGTIGSKPITQRGLYKIYKDIFARAKIDHERLSTHSIRRGFVTEGGRQGKPIGDLMKLSGHKSFKVVMEYYEAGSLERNSCINLLE
ncbi:phage integrase family protein [Chlamydia ibidis]|uniref:Phage integrase family protein n=1 Tax=Chlamydia ibidis TaxID=1405396 RepID=S7KH24_9CHLA|nr:site-specific integrase [Chlamydia ibidis]EPP35486.1 phage integrase family protein [Chlamydia ibidis]